MACGIGYLPRERRVEGLVLFLSVAANITLPDLDRLHLDARRGELGLIVGYGMVRNSATVVLEHHKYIRGGQDALRRASEPISTALREKRKRAAVMAAFLSWGVCAHVGRRERPGLGRRENFLSLETSCIQAAH